MTALRFGVIGCGGIGELRAKALRAAGMPLAAAADADAGKARALAGRHGAAIEADWRALVARADVDAVLVATPHHLHAEMTLAALAAGKHVLCEKPLACTPDEGRQMVAAAVAAGRFLATGFNYRFFPSVRKARAVLDAGTIGPLDHIRAYGGYSAATLGQAWVRDATVSGGGALHDIGIHLLDLTNYFLGGITEAQGVASGRVWQYPGCEDTGFVLLRGPDGQIASVGASWTEWRGYYFGLELHGVRGCIEVSCFPTTTRVMSAAQLGGRTRCRRYLFPLAHLREKLFTYRAIVVDSFIAELCAFAAAVRGEPSAVATGRDGLLALEVAHAAARSVPADLAAATG